MVRVAGQIEADDPAKAAARRRLLEEAREAHRQAWEATDLALRAQLVTRGHQLVAAAEELRALCAERN